MTHEAAHRDAFIAVLNTRNIAAHIPPSGRGVVVTGTLNLTSRSCTKIPDDMTVLGDLLISGALVHLPERLCVQGDLYLDDVPCSTWPECLSVHGSVLLKNAGITELPENFRVRQSLQIQGTALTELPEGLDVGYTLDLSDSAVACLPRNLRVAGVIIPPHRLLEIPAFMQAHPDLSSRHDSDLVVLSRAASAHHVLDLHDRLAAFPDLSRVFASMPPRYGLHLRREGAGYTARFQADLD